MTQEELAQVLESKAKEIMAIIHDSVPEDGYYSITCWRDGWIFGNIAHTCSAGKDPILHMAVRQ